VIGDATRLQQIALNLLSNAVKFTNSGGVSLRVEVIGGQARVTVEDTGCGIPDKDREVIFEQFIQLRPDLGKRPEGTGLGLSIARALADLHKGAMWLDESEVGRGSTFVFSLPLLQDISGEAAATNTTINGNRMTV
jgi:signal transduction histidine kinase